jgi:hypothetical protein
MANRDKLALEVREQQENDPGLGAFFKAMHTFADRTMETFFQDAPNMPSPVISLERDRPNRLGYYRPKDGTLLYDRININPRACRDGKVAAETLAHELVHLWECHTGVMTKGNNHKNCFHEKMLQYGIQTKGRLGHHIGYSGTIWPDWMEENKDLELEKFVLNNGPEARRRMHKFQCPGCGVSVRNRNVNLFLMCGMCDMELEWVAPK